MKQVKSEIFQNIHFQTQLLESVGWDDEQLKLLNEYLEKEFNADILKNPNQILKNISEFFGESAMICIKKLMTNIVYSYNLHNTNSKDVN